MRYLPGETLPALHRRHGPVIDSGVGRRGVVYVLGPEANKFIFANSDAFRMRETMQFSFRLTGGSR